jgi:hypothetical protein
MLALLINVFSVGKYTNGVFESGANPTKIP